jgi:PST family polysaccharide transporter
MGFLNQFKWSLFTQLAATVIQPLTFIILAHFLTPEDFGIMTSCLLVITFSQIFWEAGMGKAIIQRQTYIKDSANAAFIINVGLGVLIAILIYLFAPSIAEIFFKDSRVAIVLQVMSFQILLGALCSVHFALMQKEMKFQKIFNVRLSAVFTTTITSVWLAFNGWGHWALVIGTLTGQFTQFLVIWWVNSWRPGLIRNINVIKNLSLFGLFSSMSALLSWFFIWIDSFFVLRYLGIQELGLFRYGNQIVVLIFGTIIGSAIPVLYSNLVKIDQDKIQMKIASIKIIKIVTITSIPIGIVLFQFSELIGNVFFGEKWNGVGQVIGVMGLMNGFSWIVGINPEIYRAMNKPSLETKVLFFCTILYTIGYFYSIQFGFEFFLWARLILSLFGLTIHLLALKHLLELQIIPVLLKIAIVTFVSSMWTLIIYHTLLFYIGSMWVSLIVGISLSGLLITITLLYLERNGITKELKIFINNHNIWLLKVLFKKISN